MARANIAAPTITAEDLARHERELLYGFDIVGNDAPDGPVTANRDSDGNRDRFANATPILDRPVSSGETNASDNDATTPPPAGNTPTVRTRKTNTKLES